VRDPQALARFQREAKMAVKLKHANVVRAFHMGNAAGVYFLVNVTSVCAAIAISEDRPFAQLLRTTLAPAAVATTGSTSLGVLVAVLAPQGSVVALVVPVLGLLMVSSRSVAVHRAERLRFERLYAASFRTGRLLGVDDALVTLAGEARALVTGSAALCAVDHPDGTCSAVVVDDTGNRPATTDELAAARALLADRAEDQHAVTLSRHQVPAQLQWVDRDVVEAVAAISPPGDDDRVLMVVLRSLDDARDHGHGDVLAVFCRHAALTVANARLYQEVEAALHRQVDLNRQKDDFLAAVSHELRTPLTSILGSVDTIARLGERMSEDRRAQFCAMAKNQGLRLKRLIEELLLVAAADAGSMGCAVECIDVPRLMSGLALEFGPLSNDRVVVSATGGDAPLFSDEDKVRRVLVNLIENAVKYAPAGLIEVEAERMGSHWQFEVRDHGPGISIRDRERIFERFVQLDQSSTRRHGGTGLGLYLCRQLAEALGGSLTVSGVNPGGTRFVLTVPSLVSDSGAAEYLAVSTRHAISSADIT